MPHIEHHDLSFDDFDEKISPRDEYFEFDSVVEKAISRRGFLSGVLTVGAAGFVIGIAPHGGSVAKAADRFGFKQVTANSLDTITVPEGYKWQVMAKWGDALFHNSILFDEVSRGDAKSQELSLGDNNDGMDIFSKDGRNIFVVNNEYVNRSIIFGNRESGLPETDDDILKGKMGHGVTIMEVARESDGWKIVKGSEYNRRITPDTPIEITGPARGHALMKTSLDVDGILAQGTWNNCGNGRTPWGTYLACEENFNGYFSTRDASYEQTSEHIRYGISNKDWGYAWSKIDDRFDLSKEPNECNRAGYIEEINPFNSTSTPKKLTALGRFKHENAEVVIASNGQIVIYMGDDERGEFIYKYVSDDKFSVAGDNSSLLVAGKLYVAKFNDDQSGDWIELNPETTGMTSQAEINIYTRQAASKVGATTMDRPEWVASNPNKAELYCALTNNKNRGVKTNAGGDPTPVGGPNPRPANKYGQIVRWVPEGGDHVSAKFSWDLFLLAGNPNVHEGNKAGSANINASNMFNSPDGISFDSKGFLWIQTDGKYSNEGDFEGMGNNQMLVADTDTGEIRRFLVGPNECEVTGATWSADGRTMFVGIQHPGEKGNSHWPDGGTSVPKSAIIAIEREDGGIIG